MKKCISRRDFLRCSGKVLAIGALLPISSFAEAAGEAENEKDWNKVWEGKEYGFLVDTEKCIGCGSCVKACKLENDVPQDEEVYRTWVERYIESEDKGVQIDSPKGGQVFPPLDQKAEKQFFVPKLCNQCHNPPCVQVCPVGATYKTGDGVVLVDSKRCVGCRYCIQACPYGARFLHSETKVADKCTWCYHRVMRGMKPACVTVCPVGARKFGNLKEHGGELAKALQENRIRSLKPEMGTKPYVFYIGLDEVVK